VSGSVIPILYIVLSGAAPANWRFEFGASPRQQSFLGSFFLAAIGVVRLAIDCLLMDRIDFFFFPFFPEKSQGLPLLAVFSAPSPC